MTHSPTTDLVNAGGGLIALVVGIGILALARGQWRALAVGAYASCFGLLYVIENVFHAGSTASFAIGAAALATAIFGFVLAMVIVPRPIGQGAKAYLAIVSVASVVPAAFTLADPSIAAANFDAAPSLALSITTAAMQLAKGAGFALAGAAALAYRATAAGAARERRALLLLALSTGIFVEFQAASIDLWNAYSSGVPLVALQAFLVGPALVLLFLPTPGTPEPRLARLASLSLAAAGVAGAFHSLTFVLLGEGYGAFGIGRTVGAALLIVAIARYDLLGVSLPRIAVARGPLAAATLAVLFIVAQVAQNVFEAQYGLLMGGVVAGAFLFAAQPLLRGFERLTERPSPVASGPLHASTYAPSKQEDAYRRAVRLALRDRRLTHEEEIHLFHVAEALGIPAGRAMELRHEVERTAEGDARGVA